MSAEIVVLPGSAPRHRHTVLSDVETYWDGLRNGRGAPARAEVNPRGLSTALADCFILERIAPGLARIRVAGRRVAAIQGGEVQGLPFGCLFSPAARGALEDCLEQVFSTPCVADIALTARSASLLSGTVSGEMLLLPLRDDLGRTTRILGCLKTDTEVKRNDLRLDIARPTLRPIGRHLPLRETSSAATGAEPPVQGEVIDFPNHHV